MRIRLLFSICLAIACGFSSAIDDLDNETHHQTDTASDPANEDPTEENEDATAEQATDLVGDFSQSGLVTSLCTIENRPEPCSAGHRVLLL